MGEVTADYVAGAEPSLHKRVDDLVRPWAVRGGATEHHIRRLVDRVITEVRDNERTAHAQSR